MTARSPKVLGGTPAPFEGRAQSNLPLLRAVHVLEQSRVCDSRPALLRVFELTPDLPEAVKPLVRTLRECGIRKKYVGGMSVGRWRCHRPWCPGCRSWDATGDSVKNAKKLILRVGGMPEKQDLFWLTVKSGAIKQAGADFHAEATEFVGRLRKFHKKRFSKSVWMGGLHLSQASDQPGYLHLHAHVLVWMPDSIPGLLQRMVELGFREHKGVQVDPMKAQRSVLSNVLGTQRYKVYQDVRVKGRGELTGAVLAGWMLSINSISKSGRQGLRLHWGVNGKNVKHDW